jgi:uncharacterized protein YjbI with pentapeptide repeats
LIVQKDPQENANRADIRGMTQNKPRRSADRLYELLQLGEAEEFNRLRKTQTNCDLRGCDFRGTDLTGFDIENIDFSGGYFRQADLRGLDMRTCGLAGASLHSARVSGVYFPIELTPDEIEMSVRLGTRLRYR